MQLTETTQSLPVTTGHTAMDLAETMFGPGITIVDATYSGDPQSAGIYSGGDSFAPTLTPADSGVILSTGKAASVTNGSGDPNTATNTSFDSGGVDGDASMDGIAGMPTQDAAIFEATFIPDGNWLTMQVTFASEEYLEYVKSGFNDAVGIWVNGQKAELTVGTGDISIDNINDVSNTMLFLDNRGDAYNTEMDGLTVTLSLKAQVTQGQVNTIKIGIADAGDNALDSNLLIAADSVQTGLLALDDSFTIARDGSTVVDLLGNDVNTLGGQLTITMINGQPVVAGSVVILPDGLEIMVNADGTITVVSDPSVPKGPATFSYEVTNASGMTDVGFVQGQVVPCFVAGAMIATHRGIVPVERVRVGDLVQTLDHGFQPVRWHGARMVRSEGVMAAICVPPSMLGAMQAHWVSPQHRLRLSGLRVGRFLGLPDILVKARHLMRLGLAQEDARGAPVVYHHLLFDRHEIILADGIWSESFYPGPMALRDRRTRAEIVSLFPHLGSGTYGPLARPECSLREAAVLLR